MPESPGPLSRLEGVDDPERVPDVASQLLRIDEVGCRICHVFAMVIVNDVNNRGGPSSAIRQFRSVTLEVWSRNLPRNSWASRLGLVSVTRVSVLG
jgi:hypothetical protein